MEKQILLMNSSPQRRPRSWRGIPLMALFMLATLGLHAQSVVKGKISDETGASMPGVNVIVKGTTTGTTSDADGAYSINVSSDDAVLVFSFIGYTTEEVTVGGRTTVDLAMSPSAESLAEVVVVGYGTQKKSDVTGAMVRVDEASLREVPVANMQQSLQGRAAGVDINMTSPRPGAGAQIRIRGNRSLTATNEPLIVVDGIPFNGDINDINPSDIVSMDILKDASATAIYGFRGSNGVILVSTKRGKIGKAQLFYDGYYGVSSAVGKYKLYNGPEFDAFRTEARAAGAAYTPTADEAANLAAGNQTDWQDEMYESGYITNHSLGASGGTEQTQFSLSGGYFKQTTVLPGQRYTRYSVNATIDQKIGERVKLGINTMNSFNINDGENANFMFQLLTLSPLYNAYNPDGTIYQQPAIGSVDPQTRNPLLIRDESNWKQQRRRLRTFNSLYGEVKIVEGLKYRLNLGLDLFQDNYGDYYGSNTPFLNGSTNTAVVRNRNSWQYTAENLLIYDKTFAERHKFLFTGLFSVQEMEDYQSAMNATTLPADYMYYYNLGLAITSDATISNIPNNASFYRKQGVVSYMGRVNYGFADRYLITLTARNDGSSVLAEGNKWKFYPAAAFAWNIHNESFMQSVGAISNLKLRFGIGGTSNAGIDPYTTLGTLGGLDGRTAEPYNFGGNGSFGYLVTSSPNPLLTWEYTKTTNLGLDFGLIANRITGTVEVYEQKSEKILQRVALPQTAGVGAVTKNIGATRNRGIELSLNTVNIESSGDGFGWVTDLNVFLNRGEVTALAGGVQQDINNGWFVGHPVGTIYDYEKIGIVQTEDTGLPAGFTAGEIKIKDQLTVDSDGDGIFDAADGTINAADRVILGSTQPKWQGGMTNRFTFKGFDLSVVLFWKVGGMLVSNLYQANISNPINTLEGRRNGPKVDYWTPTNPTNKYPRPGLAQVPDYGSTLGYFDATYMKIRSIMLGYNLPSSFIERAGLSSARIYLQAQNPFKAFFSDYVKEGGVDPETNGFGGAVTTPGFGPNGTNGLTVNPNTPPTRSIIVGLNLKF